MVVFAIRLPVNLSMLLVGLFAVFMAMRMDWKYLRRVQQSNMVAISSSTHHLTG